MLNCIFLSIRRAPPFPLRGNACVSRLQPFPWLETQNFNRYREYLKVLEVCVLKQGHCRELLYLCHLKGCLGEGKQIDFRGNHGLWRILCVCVGGLFFNSVKGRDPLKTWTILHFSSPILEFWFVSESPTCFIPPTPSFYPFLCILRIVCLW